MRVGDDFAGGDGVDIGSDKIGRGRERHARTLVAREAVADGGDELVLAAGERDVRVGNTVAQFDDDGGGRQGQALGGGQQQGGGEGPGKGEVVEAQVDGRGGAGFSRDGDTAAVGRLEQSTSKIATEFEVEQG